MDYEMMVKCAYEEIVGEIEKEAAFWPVRSSDLGHVQRAAAARAVDRSSAADSKMRDALRNGLSRYENKVSTIGDSLSKTNNALADLKNSGAKASPALAKLTDRSAMLSKQLDGAKRKVESIKNMRSHMLLG